MPESHAPADSAIHGDAIWGEFLGHARARVAQPLAGPDGGTLFIPRIGQEVLVGFLEGDIDPMLKLAAEIFSHLRLCR